MVRRLVLRVLYLHSNAFIQALYTVKRTLISSALSSDHFFNFVVYD